ncbi:MAG: NAD-binding protein [Anaerolinea sp.]|nr:NAD-binding protein [Anaerolinea sp.]
MKSLPTQLYYFLRHRPGRMSILNLLRFLLLLTTLITTYSVLFHYIMAYEGQYHSWVTGFYWTLTVMSTLGFGDITFQSDLGRIFSSVVLLSGVFFLLILLPFTFIEFFYAPWMRLQNEKRAPSSLPPNSKGHVILTAFDPVTSNLIKKLDQYHYEYVLLVSDLNEALQLHDLGYRVVRGDLDSPETYRRVATDRARLVATTANDMLNTNVAYTVREISETVPIMATANFRASVDILELAGSNHVLQLGEMLGQALARRVSGGSDLAHVIGQFDELLFAEAPVGQTPLAGKTVRESRLREQVGVTILGVWERGKFENVGPDTLLTTGTVLVLVGLEADIARYNQLYYHNSVNKEPVVIIGGGRVGRAAGRALLARGLEYRIVERAPERIKADNEQRYILGDAAELHVLEKAGIMETGTVVISTHDDDTNIYLTIYCRRLRPNVRIVSRATLERNVATLHRAGADFVMSYASMGANAILTLLDRSDVLMVAEGLDIFRVPMPAALAGRTLAEANIRRKTGCTVVAWQNGDEMTLNPDPHTPLPATAGLILIGSVAAEKEFLQRYE